MASLHERVARLLEDQSALALPTLSRARLDSALAVVHARAPLTPAASEIISSSLTMPSAESVDEAQQYAEALYRVPPEPVITPPSCAANPPRGAFSLQVVREELGDCTRCKLCKGRKNIVFGVGSPTARLCFVGEGPGADEDIQGEPFVGKAGQLLTKMIEAMGLQRSDVYICNVIKCRPPNNRDPEPDEVAACEPFLIKQLQAVQPEIIVTLGKHAAHSLLRETTAISRMRGKWKTYQGIKVMPTFHPAYLLRNPAEKRAVWEDLKAVMRELGMPGQS